MSRIITAWKAMFEDENNRYNTNLVVLILLFFCGCIIYFTKIAMDLPNPDAIWNGMFFKENCGWEISLGRYMIAVLQKFRSYTVNTAFITLVCIILLSLICIYVIKIFAIKTLGWKLVIGILIIISPTVGSTLTYYYCSDFYMLSYFLAVLAVWLMLGEGKVRLLAASICLMCSAAIYQAYISLAILLCFIYMMRLLLDPKREGGEIIKRAVRFLIGGIIGIGLYLISNKMVQQICKINAQEDRGFSEMGSIHFDRLFEQIRECYQSFWQYYFDNSMINNFCYFRREINIVFFCILGSLILGVLIKSNTIILRKLMVAIMCMLYPVMSLSICILAPETSIFGSTGVLMLPTMNYIYVLAVIFVQQLEIRGFLRQLCSVATFVSVTVVFGMLLQLELEGQVYTKHNMMKTYHVASRIEETVNTYGENAKYLCIIGNMESGNYPENYPELADSQHWVTAGHKTIWADFNGCQSCWHEFMKQYLGKSYTMCSKEQYDAIIETPEYLAMGIFPKEDGILLINDTVVIKLSDLVGTW